MAAQGLVWVAEDAEGLQGFVACQIFPDALHIWEVSVRLEQQRRGIGHALVGAAISEARALLLPAVTLTTFDDIRWNGPFYRRLGFESLAKHELNPRLADVARKEAAIGLDMANRGAMRLVF